MHPAPNHVSRRHAFTLLELAVVIAIIGLLVGGIMVGGRLLKQSEVQTIVADYTKYSTAVANFRQQYGGYPGDLLDATNYWGDDNTNCADAAVTNGTPGTCNGDNDGDMSDNTSAALSEPYRAWQQLVLANYISGSFTGVDTGNAVPGTNIPKSRVTNAGWSFGYKITTSAIANEYDQDLNNFLAIGTVTGDLTQGAAITPQDAYQIDTKMDNGLPGTGRVVTLKPTVLANCSLNPTPGTDTLATYNVSNTTTACSLNISLTLK